MAASIDESHWVLLYSGTQASYSGRYSYLAHGLIDKIEDEGLERFSQQLSTDRNTFENMWFGYLGYGLKDRLEKLRKDEPNWIKLPALLMMRFNSVYRFDHKLKTVTLFQRNASPVMQASQARVQALPEVVEIAPTISREEYLKKTAHVIDLIHAGELYQANLTRKCIGHFKAAPDPFSVFRMLCAVSPAPYSAFLKLGDTAIASSSPELFLHIDDKGLIRTRPVKGTAPRHSNPELDTKLRNGLAASTKDRSENLMIVDLMRNDLSRACIPGSVETRTLFEVTSHANVHHMSSTIVGQKRPDCSSLEAITYCFPPGSMTGAPKIRAMELCSELERLERGVYSGAIGWLGGDGSCELSVVIRTLIIRGEKFEFQVGGGIVADSSPEAEFAETIDKSIGILKAIGINPQALTH